MSTNLSTLLSLFCIMYSVSVFGQTRLEEEIAKHARSIDGNAGVYAKILETRETVYYQAEEKYPMQSVYKFPIAMAVLDRVDQGEFDLEQIIHVMPSDYIPRGYSPIREKFPEGVDLTVRELIRYSVMESDGSASDVLLKIIGGTEVADQYIHELGVKDMAIATTEMIQVANDTIQYQNWATPKAMTQLLEILYMSKFLSDKSQALLLKYMTESKTGTKRLKGLLPTGTVVAHKTGTAGTFNGLTRATNDVGIITLPNGKHLAISIFISDSHASAEARDQAIANISKTVFDAWKGK